ncbi:MAG: lysoplasmalogenase [Lutibacter sp.]|nr:lysoplasmalogenase [Lutibacter sp.]
MVKKIALFAFVLVSVLDLIGLIFNIESLLYVFKPFIMLTLLFLYTSSVVDTNKWYSTALIFSFFGDVFLMYSGQLPFKIGLISFLIAHILFIKIVISRIKEVKFLKALFSAIPFLAVFSFLIFTLKDSLHEMLWPVVIYGLTIATFGAVSLLDFLNTKSKKSILMLFGAVIFMISDSLLAINKFYSPVHIIEVFVMITYVVAQYLIFLSMIKKTPCKENKTFLETK